MKKEELKFIKGSLEATVYFRKAERDYKLGIL